MKTTEMHYRTRGAYDLPYERTLLIDDATGLAILDADSYCGEMGPEGGAYRAFRSRLTPSQAQALVAAWDVPQSAETGMSGWDAWSASNMETLARARRATGPIADALARYVASA
jgi:hypothetical protein